MNGTGVGICPMVVFVINGAEPSGSNTNVRLLV